MDRSSDVLRSKVIGYSLLAATVAAPATLVIAVVGQGVCAFVGNCYWIGVSLPVGRQVWALVNQPSLSFAAQNQALGYWLGSLLLPLLVAVTVVHMGPRPQSLSAELLALQLAWACATIGVSWLPLVDGADGHIARMLYLRRLPPELVWLAPVIGAAAACLPVLRLLSLARRARRNLGRTRRLWVVALHLVAPTAAWYALASWLGREAAPLPAIALTIPVVVGLAVAWVGYPAAHVRPLRELTGGAFIRAVLAATALAATLWWSGRPLAPDRWSGVLWGTPSGLNNIRTWIDVGRAWSVDQADEAQHPDGGNTSAPTAG